MSGEDDLKQQLCIAEQNVASPIINQPERQAQLPPSMRRRDSALGGNDEMPAVNRQRI